MWTNHRKQRWKSNRHWIKRAIQTQFTSRFEYIQNPIQLEVIQANGRLQCHKFANQFNRNVLLFFFFKYLVRAVLHIKLSGHKQPVKPKPLQFYPIHWYIHPATTLSGAFTPPRPQNIHQIEKKKTFLIIEIQFQVAWGNAWAKNAKVFQWNDSVDVKSRR